MLCPFCKEEIQDGAIKCKHCGSMINAATNVQHSTVSVPAEGRDKYTDYNQVPWFRKRWVFIISILLIAPLAVVIILSGDVYYLKNGELKVMGKTPKIIAIIWTMLFVVQCIRGFKPMF